MKIDDLFEKKPRTFYKELSKLKMNPTKEMIKELEEAYSSGYTSYYSFFRTWKGRIVEQTFAIAKKYKKVNYQEVMRRVEGCNECLVKNMYFSCMGGYKTVWSWTRPSYYYWYEGDRNVWFIERRKDYNVYRTYSKSCFEFIENNYPELKYNTWKSMNVDPYSFIDWLTIYKSYPVIEILGKIGLSEYAKSLTFLKKMASDKKFLKYLIKYKDEIIEHKRYLFGASKTIISAYNQKRTPLEAIKYQNVDSICRAVPQIKIYKKENIYNYLKKHSIEYNSYKDFLEAIAFLGLDFSNTKNVFPHNFREWHDRYTEQYSIVKCEKENHEIDVGIKNVHDKYIKYENYEGNYKIVIPNKTLDLVKEGKALEHCVGRMNYNKKMAEETSIILFIRKEADVPLYTMEYDPHNKTILQFYGYQDKPVEKNIRNEIETWLQHFKLRKKKGVEYLYG